MGSRGPTVILLLLCGILGFTSVFAGPVGLPDSARPGAVRPEQKVHIEIPSNPVAEVLDVPAVIERPFDVDEGDVVVVTDFRLLDVEDLPEFDISIDEVKRHLEAQKLLKPGGFTIGQLQGVADSVTNHYRQRGLILAQAVLPVQTVSGGVVDIQVFVGTLGRILAEGNEMYVKEILEKPFRKLIGRPISKAEVEAALLTLTDYPGLSVFGVFQPGVHIGTADIVLKIQEEKRFDVAFRADTHGTRETGRNRLRTIVDWNNFTGFSDRLTLSAQQSYNPKNNTFYAMDYERFFAKGFKVGGFVNQNTFDVGGEFADRQINAKSENQGVFVEKTFIRSRQKNLSTRIGFTRKKSQTITFNNITSRDRLSVFTLSADFDSVDTFSLSGDSNDGGGGINFAFLEFSQGVNNLFSSMGSATEAEEISNNNRGVDLPVPSRQGGGDDRPFAAGKFKKIFASYTRLQTIRKNHSLLFRTEFQWTKDILVPLEQYSVGGPDNLRAFPTAQVLWDRAYFVSFEWLINAPFFADKPAFDNRTWGELLQVSAFYDQAVGRLNNPSSSDQQRYESLRGVGLGVRFTIPGMIESKLLWASEVGGNDVGNERAIQVWGDMTYRF